MGGKRNLPTSLVKINSNAHDIGLAKVYWKINIEL